MPLQKHSSSSKRTPARMSQYTFSHYPDDQVLHYYRWTSPPGVMKILSIIIIIMCVAIFACVASTLAWDYGMEGMGFGGLGMGLGGGYYGSSMYGGGMGGGSYGYGGGYGGYGAYVDPVTGKGFMIAISAIVFIAVMVIFVLVISRQSTAKSTKFYLASAVICALMAFLMFVASIVYLVAVNPMAQGAGSVMYNMIWQICSQYQGQSASQTSALVLNQYLYHYCVVDPQEAIAIVLGFLVAIGLIIMLVFAIKTRSQINQYGMQRVLWEPRIYNDGLSHGVEKWVTDVSGDPEVYLKDHNDMVGASPNYLDQSMDMAKPLYLPGDSDTTSTTIVKGRVRDYDTGGESADELDDTCYDSEFPPILNDTERSDYKRQFDRDLMEYKRLQAELDDINLGLSEVDRELDNLQEGSPQFLDAMEVYTRLKNMKRSSEYQIKKKKTKQLKTKLSFLKRRVNDYDRRP